MTTGLATTQIAGAPTAVLVVDDRHYLLADACPQLTGTGDGLIAVLRHWDANEPAILDAVERLRQSPEDAPETAAPERAEQWLTPLQYPDKVICTGFNYQDHVARDAGRADFSKDENVPVFFMKPPTTALVGAGASVRYPQQSEKLDYEAELAVIIGTAGRKIDPAKAMSHVAAYTIGLDLSARDWQRHPKHAAKFDLFGGKAFDDSNPLGPVLVPAQLLDPGSLHIEFFLNGEKRQDATTDDMIWSIAEQIALISEHVTLAPGDVIMTGTPSGVGSTTGTWLCPGDHLSAQISQLGALEVQITADPDPAAVR